MMPAQAVIATHRQKSAVAFSVSSVIAQMSLVSQAQLTTMLQAMQRDMDRLEKNGVRDGR